MKCRARAGEDDRADLRVVADLVDAVVDRARDVRVERVDRRVVDRDDRDVAVGARAGPQKPSDSPPQTIRRLTGDVARRGRGEEGDAGGDLLRRPRAAASGSAAIFVLVVLRHGEEDPGVDQPGRDAVDGDAVLGQLDRGRARDALDRALRGTVGGAGDRAAERRSSSCSRSRPYCRSRICGIAARIVFSVPSTCVAMTRSEVGVLDLDEHLVADHAREVDERRRAGRADDRPTTSSTAARSVTSSSAAPRRRRRPEPGRPSPPRRRRRGRRRGRGGPAAASADAARAPPRPPAAPVTSATDVHASNKSTGWLISMVN